MSHPDPLHDPENVYPEDVELAEALEEEEDVCDICKGAKYLLGLDGEVTMCACEALRREESDADGKLAEL